MKVSIITVCLNSAKTIRKALESVRLQTYKNIELIIVDGVSTDETLQIVTEYQDIVTTIVSEKDKGIYDAMNKGATLATGDVVFFLNSDDAFYDGAVIADVVERFKLAPTTDFLYGDVVFDDEGRLTKRTYSHINKCTLEFESLCHQGVFARRELFNIVGLFNLKFKTNADYDWLIRVFKSGATCTWFNRIISLFSLGGMHAQDPIYLAQEHTKVRLQYMSKTKLFLGDIVRRFRHRYHRHFKPYRLGEAALNTPTSNLRVTLLSHGFQAEYELGYANGLARNGVQVTLIGSDTTLKTRLEPTVKLVNLRGSQDPARPKHKKVIGMLMYWVKCYAYILLHRNTPVHVIGMFNGNPWVAIAEAWLTRILSKHFILTVHDILPHDQHTTRNAKLNGIVFKAANHYVVHAKPMISALHIDYSIDLNKIHFIEHGMDEITMPTPNSRKAGRDFFGIKDNKPLILIFGNILHYKGTDLLIQAFNQLAHNSDARLLIVGRCRKAALKQELQDMVNASKFKDRIVWYDGFLPDENVVSTFHAADVLVMPYRHIYQSGVIFMSLATGLRTIVTDVGVLRNYIEKDFGRVVPAEDITALTLAIEDLLANSNPPPSYFKNLAKPYLWVNSVKSLLTVYVDFY
jgi:glycosyltransferase involved in cell wall biosynthesis